MVTVREGGGCQSRAPKPQETTDSPGEGEGQRPMRANGCKQGKPLTHCQLSGRSRSTRGRGVVGCLAGDLTSCSVARLPVRSGTRRGVARRGEWLSTAEAVSGTRAERRAGQGQQARGAERMVSKQTLDGGVEGHAQARIHTHFGSSGSGVMTTKVCCGGIKSTTWAGWKGMQGAALICSALLFALFRYVCLSLSLSLLLSLSG